MGESAAPVRAVVGWMIEARGPAVVFFLVVVTMLVPVVMVMRVEKNDRAVDVNVVVAVVQRVQPRKNGQRGAEGAEHQTGR